MDDAIALIIEKIRSCCTSDGDDPNSIYSVEDWNCRAIRILSTHGYVKIIRDSGYAVEAEWIY